MLLQEHTKQLLDAALATDTHALLFSGPEGTGKGHVARYFASQKLGVDIEKLAGHPYFTIIEPVNNSISIEQIRELQKFLQLKVPGTASVRRAVLIENAHTMTNEAQNALLKSLEEPPADTIIMLTAPKSLQLRETIYSRVQQVPLLPVSHSESLAYFKPTHSEQDIQKAYMMSGGHVGLMQALLSAEEHPLAAEVAKAKHVIIASTFERLAQVDELSKQKEQLPLFLKACKLICTTALHQAAQKNETAKIARWHKSLGAIQDAEAALSHSPNSKLLLTDLFLHL